MAASEEAVPMLLWCPLCHARHIDRGDFRTKLHHTHACQSCGLAWLTALEEAARALVGAAEKYLAPFSDSEPAATLLTVHVGRLRSLLEGSK